MLGFVTCTITKILFGEEFIKNNTVVISLINANSPFQTNVSHKRSTLQGQFSFVSNNISPVKGGGGQTYNSTSGKPSGVISVPAARGSTN